MILGIGLMGTFLNLVQAIYFFARLSAKLEYSIELTVTAVGMYQWMWVPNIAVMAILYYILVYKIPYEEKKQ